MAITPLKILLVEDNFADANFLQEILVGRNDDAWNITHVESVREAIEQLGHQSFDVVLSDLSLPDAQGIEAVQCLHMAVPELPIVVLTGQTDEEIGLQAVREGAQDYLIKGQMDSPLLSRTIHYAIERSRTRQVIQQQAAAMDACREGIAILNSQQIYTYVNQAHADLYGYDHPAELLGKPWQILYDEAEQTRLETVIPILIQQGYWFGEAMGLRRNGTRFYQEFSLTQIDSGNFLCNVRDISDRKQIEAEISRALAQERELNQLKSRFISMVSHEFRNPMTAIRTCAELLQNYNSRLSEEKKDQYFRQIQTSIQHMLHLLDEVLLLGRSEVGALQYEPAPLDLPGLCQSLVEGVQLSAENCHRIRFTCEGDCTTAVMDGILLRHIFTNLLSNAIKYSPTGGDIQFSLFCRDNQAMFRIQDSGIGIPVQDQARLFETFHRASNVGKVQGTGLGLAIVKNCVDLHRGQIQLHSQEGVGTTFTITLPLVPCQETASLTSEVP